MWSKRQNSHTSEFPERVDLIKGLLQKMLDQKMVGVWVHFELIKEAGWFKNLLSGNAPFLEVALATSDNFAINLGKPEDKRVNQIATPGNWKSEKNGLHNVPVSELTQLVNGLTNFSRTRQVK
ncbi:MAG: hypothetical protein ABUL66_03265 [Verrucomicrobiota bacterium]